METYQPVENWLDMVAYSGSGSEKTRINYRWSLDLFLKFTGTSAEQILKDYELVEDERDFKRKYALYVKRWIAKLQRLGYASKSIKTIVSAVKSFFLYNDLPLGRIPMARDIVTYHNRDITKEEITDFMSIANARDRAFFCVMAQSGLRPNTLCRLRLKHLEPDLSNGVIPCKINVPQDLAKGKYHSYFTFIGEESTRHLKNYFKTRSQLSRASLVFTKIGTEDPLNPKVLSVQFHDYAEKLRQKGILEFERKKKGKPATIRLYNLRKYFRKYANQAGFEYVEFWMGHKGPGVDNHYRPTDSEFHRALFKEKAMPFLRIEQPSPSDTEKIIEKQAEEIERLKTKMNGISGKLTELLDALDDSIKEERKHNLEFHHQVLEGFGSKLMGKGVERETILEVLREFIEDEKKS